MPAALGLDHIVLVVDDVERSLAWYGRFAGLGAEGVDGWRKGELPFPSLRIDEGTIIDLIPGLDDPTPRGHLDHICLVVTAEHQAELAADPDLEVIDSGPRSGARGIAESIYVRDPDGLTVEFRAYPA
ncbi:MAG TPA: VOC family protein [Acidimicrobiales bacterium]|nr:VOC family protein [Acidimicrobiales bacterium]